MYTMVLMAAVTGGSAVPGWGHWGGSGCGCGPYGGGYSAYFAPAENIVGGPWGGWPGGAGYSGGITWGRPWEKAAVTRPATSPLSSTPQYQTRPTEGATPAQEEYQPGAPLAPTYPRSEAPPESDLSRPSPATIVVHLPAEARLRVDGRPTHSTSETRTFHSPPLEPDETYSYLLEAEVRRNGETVTARRSLIVRAGREYEVYLEPPAPSLTRR